MANMLGAWMQGNIITKWAEGSPVYVVITRMQGKS
jgi:hypothetical protein